MAEIIPQTHVTDVFLLAGGRSTRMGRDKALLAFGESTFLEVISQTVRPLAATITVAGRSGQIAGLPAIPDLRPGLGPLAGIETALSHSRTATVLLIPCDTPLVTAAFLSLLLDRAARSPRAIVVPRDTAGRTAHLCGVFPRTALATVTRLLDDGERKPLALLRETPAEIVDFSEYEHLPGATLFLRNVNTPEEYVRMLAEAGLPGTA